ncbi:hypothetical protein AURDEDRAFT_181891 [Auricularia subglabra TFB-10046 SS5]|nr:hypothetical protein AURDEDRAFT_181891 [Auricularia subglabra TFB-10046 SS5]
MSSPTEQTHAAALAQHPPAVKVAGRRLSSSNKPRPHPTQGQHKEPASSTAASTGDEPEDGAKFDDYPRPAGPAAEHHEHEHHGFEPYGKRPEHVLHDAKPAADAPAHSAKKEAPAHGRITQPPGKALGV